MAKRKQNPPGELGPAGRRWWKTVFEGFDPLPEQVELVRLAAIQLDRAAAARAEVEKAGMFEKDRYGGSRLHPGIDAERQATTVFRLLCRQLGVAGENDE